ncbi:MAG TPA: hypothetical protein VIE65_15515 [Methylobacter sp.]|jgi:hypothetical protein
MEVDIDYLRNLRQDAYEQGVKDSLQNCPHGCLPQCHSHIKAGEIVGKFFKKNLSWSPFREEEKNRQNG